MELNVNVTKLEIIEENNYYSFVLKHKGYNNNVTYSGNSLAHQYKYNGKELDCMYGLNLYDYGARHYDAALARWITPDLLAEKYSNMSSYNYFANNGNFDNFLNHYNNLPNRIDYFSDFVLTKEIADK